MGFLSVGLTPTRRWGGGGGWMDEGAEVPGGSEAQRTIVCPERLPHMPGPIGTLQCAPAKRFPEVGGWGEGRSEGGLAATPPPPPLTHPLSPALAPPLLDQALLRSLVIWQARTPPLALAGVCVGATSRPRRRNRHGGPTQRLWWIFVNGERSMHAADCQGEQHRLRALSQTPVARTTPLSEQQ